MKLSTIVILAGAVVFSAVVLVKQYNASVLLDQTRDAETQLSTACIYANQGNFVTARQMCIRLLDARHGNDAQFTVKVLNVLNQIDLAERNTIRVPTAAELVSRQMNY